MCGIAIHSACTPGAHAEPLATQRLLGVARKHGVESCVDACLQLMLTQVG